MPRVMETLALVKDYFENPVDYADGSITRRGSVGKGEVTIHLKPLGEVIDCHKLGSGAWGAVYHLTDKLVLKVAKDDDNYRAWVNFCQKHQSNPYVPRIYRTMRVDNIDIYVLERLQPREDCYDDNSWASLFVNYFETVCAIRQRGGPIEISCPHLREITDTFGFNNMNDVAGANVMLRGEQLVFTDPCSTYVGSPRGRNYDQ